MRLGTAFLFCLTWAGSGSAAEEVFATAGQSASLQKRETSARVAALGGNGASLELGSDSVLSNPAGLARIDSLEFGVHHQSWLAAINQENLSAAGPGFGGAWGASLGLVDYGQIEAMDEFGQPLGGIGAQDYSFSLAWARATGAGFSFGTAFRFSREVLAGEGQTQSSVDLGIQWVEQGWRLGLMLADASSTLLGADRGPSAIRGELSGDLMQVQGAAMRLCAGFSAEPDGMSRFQAGLESLLYQALSARAGYEARLGSTLLQGFSGATFGLGFSLGSTVFDYAYLPFGDLGAGHRVSVKWRMSRPVPVVPAVPKVVATPVPLPLPPPLPSPEPTPLATPVPVPTALPRPATDSLQFKVTEDALELARQAEQHGHFEDALALHQGLLDRHPHNAVVWRSLGDLHYRAQHRAEAVAAYDRALEEGLVNSDLEQWLEKYRSQP